MNSVIDGMWLTIALVTVTTGIAAFVVTYINDSRTRWGHGLPAPNKRCIVRNDPAFESGRVGRGVPR